MYIVEGAVEHLAEAKQLQRLSWSGHQHHNIYWYFTAVALLKLLLLKPSFGLADKPVSKVKYFNDQGKKP